jgi:kinesin family protein 5
MERVRKTMAQQLSEFDTMKKSLMRDLQNRCEKVSYLVISYLSSATLADMKVHW